MNRHQKKKSYNATGSNGLWLKRLFELALHGLKQPLLAATNAMRAVQDVVTNRCF